MKIVSFNIKCIWDAPVDGNQSFVYRKEFIVEKIRQEKPDVICFQEMVYRMYDYFKTALPEYTFLGHGRYEDLRGEGVFTSVLNEKIEVLGLEVFWMSDTPDVPASRLEGQSECPRTCVRTKLRSGNTLFEVFNLHLDHLSDAEIVRKKELEIVRNYIEKHNIKSPLFICGDFNAVPNAESILYLKNNGFVDLTADNGFTFHNFKGENFHNKVKIDYIFCSKELTSKCISSAKWTDFNGKVYLSDHYPLCCEVKM